VDTQSLGLSGFTAVQLGASVTNDYDLGASSTTSVSLVLGANAGTGQVTFTGPGFGDAHGITISPNLTGVTTTTDLVNAYNAAIQSAIQNGASQYVNAFKAANITASIHTDSAGKQQLAFTSSNNAFQVTAVDAKGNALLGFLAVAGAPAAAGAMGNLVSSGANELGTSGGSGAASNAENDITYTAVQTGAGSVTINANDSSGHAHALTIGVSAAQGASMATLLAQLNGSLQASNDSTLQQITAVQNGATAVNFISSLKNFSVQVSPSTTNGLAATAATQAMQVGNGGIADISTMAGAQAAVTAITSAVQSLGAAQAAVGKGQNQLNYAISLAQSQITNFSAAESQIRDANVAEQAANLSKAQVLQQASIAAMAQANSAPQAILALLRG